MFTDRDRQLEAQRRRLEQEKRDRAASKTTSPAGTPESDRSTMGTIVVIVAILFLLLLLTLRCRRQPAHALEVTPHLIRVWRGEHERTGG